MKFPPMPDAVRMGVIRRGVDAVSPSNRYDIHHALVTKGDVMGMSCEEKAKIHDARNLLVIPSEWNASHANIPSREKALLMLLKHYSMSEIRAWFESIVWKEEPPFQFESICPSVME